MGTIFLVYVYMYVCMCVYVYMYACICVCMYIRVCMYVYMYVAHICCRRGQGSLVNIGVVVVKYTFR